MNNKQFMEGAQKKLFFKKLKSIASDKYSLFMSKVEFLKEHTKIENKTPVWHTHFSLSFFLNNILFKHHGYTLLFEAQQEKKS